jgi:secreted trypsin-like serine protease
MKRQIGGLLWAWALAAAGVCATASFAQALVGPSTEEGNFGAHVVMVLKRGVDRAGFCTGIVIAPQIVLTAAHCAAASKNMRVHYKDSSGQPVLSEVKAVATHPGFHADALARHVASIDLALIQTQAPLDARFSPAELDEAGAVAVGQGLRIVGYGVVREGEGASAGVLRSAALQVRAPLSKILVWAEDPSGAGAGGCTGDSGGPILSQDGARVIAVTTWSAGAAGRRCGALTQGPLIAPQRAWIESVRRRWGL